MATFNFASYYMNTALSDVAIKIQLADGSPVQADLPGHGILLSNVSPQFKEEIEDKGTITLEISKVRKKACTGPLPGFRGHVNTASRTSTANTSAVAATTAMSQQRASKSDTAAFAFGYDG